MSTIIILMYSFFFKYKNILPEFKKPVIIYNILAFHLSGFTTYFIYYTFHYHDLLMLQISSLSSRTFNLVGSNNIHIWVNTSSKNCPLKETCWSLLIFSIGIIMMQSLFLDLSYWYEEYFSNTINSPLLVFHNRVSNAFCILKRP